MIDNNYSEIDLNPNLVEADTLNHSDINKSQTKIPFFKSLRFWMPMTLVFLGIIPPTLMGIGYASYRADKLLHENAKKILKLESEKLESNVSQWIQNNYAALKNLSEQPAIVSLDPEQQKPILEKTANNYRHLYLIHTTDLSGVNIARSDGKQAKDYSNRLYFTGAMAGNDITYQTLVSKTSKKPATCMSSPIIRQKEISGATIICSSMDAIVREVKQIDLGKNSSAIIVDDAGKVVAHSDSQVTSGDSLTDLSNFPPVANVLAGNEGNFTFVDDAGIEWIANGKLLDNGWATIGLQQTKEAFLAENQYKQVAVVSVIFVILLAGILTSIIVGRAVKPITELTKASRKVAKGDFKALTESDRDDEIGVLTNSFNNMAQQLQEIVATLEIQVKERTLNLSKEKERLEIAIFTLISEVSDATEGNLTVRANLNSMELSTVADLFNAIIINLQEIAIEAKRSTGQVGFSLKQNEEEIRLLAKQAIAEAQETRNTLMSVELMSQSIQTVAANATQVEKIADDTYNTAMDSTKNMGLTVNSILELRNTVNETGNKMKLLGQSSQKISQAVTLIEEIALKTNVLAVNARVEARRAGEYGQGFTIVAEQVGSLAEQSVQATKEIASIVAAIQAETGEVSQAMEAGTIQAVESTRLVEASKQSLEAVLARAQEINQLIGSISQATVSQANTSQDVTNLMQKIARLSETTSQSSAKVAQSIVETALVAQRLESTVAQFKVAESA